MNTSIAVTVQLVKKSAILWICGQYNLTVVTCQCIVSHLNHARFEFKSLCAAHLCWPCVWWPSCCWTWISVVSNGSCHGEYEYGGYLDYNNTRNITRTIDWRKCDKGNIMAYGGWCLKDSRFIQEAITMTPHMYVQYETTMQYAYLSSFLFFFLVLFSTFLCVVNYFLSFRVLDTFYLNFKFSKCFS